MRNPANLDNKTMIVINLWTQLTQFSLITVNLEIFALKKFCKNFFMLENFCREVSFQQFKNSSVNGMSQLQHYLPTRSLLGQILPVVVQYILWSKCKRQVKGTFCF